MYTIDQIQEICKSCAVELSTGYRPVRPISSYFIGQRIRDAWAVLTRKADAVIWPEDYEGR